MNDEQFDVNINTPIRDYLDSGINDDLYYSILGNLHDDIHTKLHVSLYSNLDDILDKTI